MDAGALTAHGEARDGAFYLTALSYAQYQWQRGLAARAILCLDRALGSHLQGNELELKTQPLPYQAMAWLLASVPLGVFVGNPRVHFQHLADRMNEPRREQRRWRAWACWALARAANKDWPADPKHAVTEPSNAQIFAMLESHGISGEAQIWLEALAAAVPCPRP